VTFSYPKDKRKIILNELTLEINCKNTGIMGTSGSGKSTIFQLMMRFYDPDSGTVFLDGVDLKKLDL
jgi:ABC-type multidrug transport system fused ATPase/permease subunit